MKVGIQLYSVRDYMEKDPLEAIGQVAKLGYRYLEVANHTADRDAGVGFGLNAKEVLALMKRTGTEICSAHIAKIHETATGFEIPPLELEDLPPVLAFQQEIGAKYIVQPIDFYRDRDEVLRKAEHLNQMGALCAEYGLTLLYHNHFHEFLHFGEKTIYELLMENTDPALVQIELDTYWAARGRQDPVELLKKHGRRVRLIHQKDFAHGHEAECDLLTKIEEERIYVDYDYCLDVVRPETFTEIGTGIMEIQRIIDAANAYCAAEYIILEQDHSRYDQMESISISMDSFRRFQGVDW